MAYIQNQSLVASVTASSNKLNIYHCFVQVENDPEAFDTGMCNIHRYHLKDIYQWDGNNVHFMNQRSE